jgi:hypothetical protein
VDNVVGFKNQQEINKDVRKEELLEVLDTMREMVHAGTITEFVATSLNNNGEYNIHASALATCTAVGLYEIGKMMLIERNFNDLD